MESIDATKTSMDEYNNVLWSENDQIVAFMKTTLGIKYQVKEQYVGTTTGGFSKVQDASSGDDQESGQEIGHNVVVYPYSDQTCCMKYDNNTPAKSYKLNVVLPETQTYVENSFANGAFPMVAVSANNQHTFKNICGGLKLQFKGIDKIKSIKLEGVGEEAISGKSSVVAYADDTTPTITMASTATKSVTLDCGEGVQLNETTPTTFIIAIPPVTFASGMKITVTDTDGISKTLTNSSSNTVKRSTLLNFPVITYKQEGVLELPEGTMTSYEVSAEGGTIEIPVVTNLDYEVVIPDNAKDWISVVETKALREGVITLSIASNSIVATRSADVSITDYEGAVLQTININQAALKSQYPANNEIWYTSTDGTVIKPSSSAKFGANLISNEYQNGIGIMTFDSDIRAIPEDAFYYLWSLTSITIPDSVTTIGDYAFYNCSHLTSITIPDSVTTIGYNAFYNCSRLTSITIPDSVTTIGYHAFYNCKGLKEVAIAGDIINCDGNPFLYCPNLEKFSSPIATSDGRCLVYNGVLISTAMAGLSQYTIPNVVTIIGDSAFYNCSRLTSITIPNSVTTIGYNAFYSCEGLKEVAITGDIINCDGNPFLYCPNLEKFSSPIATSDGRCLVYNGALILTAMAGLSQYTIPNSVTTIGNSAFSDCSGLTSITIPNSVTTIGYSAFSGCSGLTSITIPNSVTTIGGAAFIGCSGLTSITIPDSVTSIEEKAFADCSGLTSITIPNSVTTIEYGVFAFCSGLTGITIPNSVTSIEEKAFADCSSLTSITIPDSVTHIREEAFYGCSGLTSITIPDSVSFIGSEAFDSDCSVVFIKNPNPFIIGNHALGRPQIIYVPMESENDYLSDGVWSEYKDVIIGMDINSFPS
ncbi:MAG: leucine-rich repeat protein [Bacteroidales bacterium]|nr:leucine-rich repeat protein [Bacteroidales bacterium]